jgi:hypothetical protein
VEQVACQTCGTAERPASAIWPRSAPSAPDVREFGKRLRDDHAAAVKTRDGRRQIAQRGSADRANREAERHYDGLAQLSGGQFDAAFLSRTVVAHEAEIAQYSRNASSDDDGLATLIAKLCRRCAPIYPRLRRHSADARRLRDEPEFPRSAAVSATASKDCM